MKIEHLQRAEDLYKTQGNITREEIIQLLNVSQHEARIIRAIITDKETVESFVNASDSETSLYKEETDTEQTLITRSSDIKTLDDLLKYCKVDLDKWEVSKHVVGSWGSDKNENFQVKVWLKKREDKVNLLSILKEFREEAEHHAPEYEPIKHSIESDNILELSIHDFHLGSLVWGKETRDLDYDIKIAKELYINAVDYFLDHAKSYNPEKIVFLVGSDFYNVDNAANTTSAGTPQSEDSRFQKTFTDGWRLVVDAIDMCREIANVDVIVIPGNHDFERSYYMGEVLNAWYDKCNNVNIDNGPETRKYYEYGSNLIGFSHGLEAKTDAVRYHGN